MYIITRTIEIGASVPVSDAVQMATRMAEYVKNHQDVEIKVTINFAGALNQLHWVVMTDSLDQSPASEAERNADPEWQALVAESIEKGLFAPGTIRDDIQLVVG